MYPLQAETTVRLLVGRNAGEMILETGSKKADLTGFAGGSRLTYNRDFNFIGLGLTTRWNTVELEGRFRTTGYYVDTGLARNEDFALDQYSRQQPSGFDRKTWAYRDTAHTISGSYNFADAYGRSRQSMYDFDLFLRWFFLDDDPESTIGGPYLSLSTGYGYSKYYVYDVIQYLRSTRSFFIGPIGIGNSFSNAVLQFRGGAGWRSDTTPWQFDLGLYIISGYNTARDHHVQRGINFVVYEAYGNGLLMQSALSYRTTESLKLGVSFYFHRYFSHGFMDPRDGHGSDALLTQLTDSQSVWISTKEAGAEFQLNWIF